MRWNDLLTEIEGQHMDQAFLDRDTEAAELADGEWAAASWSALFNGEAVHLLLTDGLMVQGRVNVISADLLVVDDGRKDVVVARHHVAGIELRDRARLHSEPLSRLSWGQIARMWQRDGDHIALVLVSGVQLSGTIAKAGGDFLILIMEARTIAVPYSAIGRVMSPR